MSMIVTALALAIIHAQPWPPVDFSAVRVDGRSARAVVVAESGGTTNTYTIVEDRRRDGTHWLIERRGLDGRTDKADAGGCPAVYGLALRLERMPWPRAEIRSPAATAPDLFIPPPLNLGPTHSRFAFWARGWVENDIPAEMTLTHAGEGPIADWVRTAEEELVDCWKEGEPSAD